MTIATTDGKFVYTLSSRESMVEDAVRSISTLKTWVPGDDIIVFYTPPYDDTDRSVLDRLGVDVRETGNDTEPFSFLNSRPGHFGEKIKVCDVDADRVMFLDCDTVIAGDIYALFDGEFDVKARPSKAKPNDDAWTRLFDHFNQPIQEWMPNAGVLVFKNRAHKQLKDPWLTYLNNMPLSEGYLEQYALALAMTDFKVSKMTMQEHVIEWDDPLQPDATVYHLYFQKDKIPDSFKGNMYHALQSVKIGMEKLLQGNF